MSDSKQSNEGFPDKGIGGLAQDGAHIKTPPKPNPNGQPKTGDDKGSSK